MLPFPTPTTDSLLAKTSEGPRGAHRVLLPPRYAVAAVRLLFQRVAQGRPPLQLVTTRAEAARWGLQARGWHVVIPRGQERLANIVLDRRWPLRTTLVPGGRAVPQPEHGLDINPRAEAELRRALEFVKEPAVDERGLPQPWCPPPHHAEALRESAEDDVDVTNEAPPLPESDELPGTLSAAAIEADFSALCELLGLPAPPLVVRRRDDPQHGFVSGRVWMRAKGAPLQVRVEVGPNADRAEVLATLVHELAHCRAPGRGHDRRFREQLVEIATLRSSPEHAALARDALDESFRVVDLAVASGLRAWLRGAEAPRARSVAEERLVVTLRRIQKLRALAASSPGSAEAISATATANDLIAAYGLGDYSLRLDAVVEEAWTDRWIDVGRRQRWRRAVVDAVADHCGVFTLALTRKGWMHLFGRHADVITAEYMAQVCIEIIDRRSAQHLREWKRARGGATGGESRSEAAAFRNSAAYALADRIDAELDDSDEERSAAREFAWQQHKLRGMSWQNMAAHSYRSNAAGEQLGAELPLNRGVEGGAPRGLLDHL